MRFVSLFAGIGGFDLGLENAGFQCVGQVEIDPTARQVLETHWANVPKHDDVQTASQWAIENGMVGNVELVCGGFPCQDVSVAGKRAGLAGSRTGLFWDALNFAQTVKAKWLILENVTGLFSSNNGRDFATIIAAIRNAGFHYIEWRVFDSQFYGVPQRRRRIYIVASVTDPNRYPILVERESSSRNFAPKQQSGEEITTATGSSVIGTLCTADYRGIGNQYVNDHKLIWVKSARAQSKDGYETWKKAEVSPTLNRIDNTSDVTATVIAFGHTQGMDIQPSNQVFPTLRLGGAGHGVMDSTVRRLTPIECERLQGFPDDWTASQSDSARYRQLGNAVTVNVVEHIGHLIRHAM